MANITINTQGAQYQTRLTQLQDIKAFYAPMLRAYITIKDEQARRAWRQRDPILRELLDIWYKIEKSEEGNIPNDF